VKAVNDYSIVIQEYFQDRVTDFLENYAKQVFLIEHYFARFEFAKSRGQIHVHLLAVLGKNSRIADLNELVYKERFNPEKQARVSDDYLNKMSGLTAIHPGSTEEGLLNRSNILQPEGTCGNIDIHPSSLKISDVTDYKQDLCDLCNNCQMHGCSGYCMYRKNPKKIKVAELGENHSIQGKVSREPQETISKAKRFFRFGAGHEETVGKGDTPGFEFISKPTITLDGHGFTKHKVFKSPRNTRRMVQTSMCLTQVWRGNVDAKPLLYQSDPSNPDPEDIMTWSEYLVGYQMEGSQTIAIERKNMKDVVLRMEDKNGDITGVFMQLQNF
jgi:hypothetical protein